MELVNLIINFVLHMDTYLAQIVDLFGVWTYLLLFVVIFCETGLVITPFLPGDSIIFVAGALAGIGALNIVVLFFLLVTAAILGDSVNYWLGSVIGVKAFDGRFRYLKQEHLDKTHAFFERHGGKAIILARFVPLMRTFVPFVAGLGAMDYGHFITFNIIGGTVWVSLFLFAGYFFGSIPFVQDNFSLIILAVIMLSLIPVIIEVLRDKVIRPRSKKPDISEV